MMVAQGCDPEQFAGLNGSDLARQDNQFLAFGCAAHVGFGAPLARMEDQFESATLLRRLRGLTIEESAMLVWREILGLRGL
jgi:cytochrome P450